MSDEPNAKKSGDLLAISRPASLDDLREIYRSAPKMPGHFPELSQGEKGAIIGAFTRFLKSDHARRMFFKYVFNVFSSKDLNPAGWFMLSVLLDAHQNADGKWEYSHYFQEECSAWLEQLFPSPIDTREIQSLRSEFPEEE